MDADDDIKDRFLAVIKGIQRANEADLLIFNGLMFRPHDDRVIDLCTRRRRRKNVFLILTTFGGDPSAAYRTGRALQHFYSRVIAFVPGHCKSAGTLLLLGAHELVLAPHAELGPLDAQVARSDETDSRTSSLTPTDALRVLESRSVVAFANSFRDLRSSLQMPTRLASQIAVDLVAGLYSEVFAQIDPMRLGELDRAVRVATEYGQRLIAVSKNAKEGTLAKLTFGYPSHDFVIDVREAKELFQNVREANSDEMMLAMRTPLGDTLVDFFGDELQESASSHGVEPTNRSANPSPRAGEVRPDDAAPAGRKSKPG